MSAVILLVVVALILAAASAPAQTLPGNLTLTNISILGQPRTLVLYQRSVRATNFHYLVWSSANGYQTNTPPPVRTYRGTVADLTNTIVCAIIKPGGLLKADGFDYELGKSYTWSVDNVNVSAQLPAGSFRPSEFTEITASKTATEDALHSSGGNCGCPECHGEFPSSPAPFVKSGTSTAQLGTLPRSTYMPPAGGMQVMDLGVDITHYRYAQTYGGNADLAFASIEHTVNIYDLLMARDALIAIQESVVVLRQDIFYVPTGMGDQLNLMTSTWKAAPLAALPWDQIHSFATEQGLFGAGGYAWGNAIGKDESPANVEALYHEAGHNWDVVHIVYGRDTMGGNKPNHGPFSIDRLLRKRNESMTEGDLSPYPGTYPDPLPPYTHVDCASTLTNTPVNINVLTNDWDGNANAITVIAFSTNTTKGGTVSWISNGILRYTPAPGYVGKDLFAYTVRDSTGLRTRDLVHVEIMNRNLQAYYAFDETTGKTATDATGFGHAGKLQGATDFTTHSEPGIMGLALRVDSGGIICDNSPLMPPDVTLVNDDDYWPFDNETMSRGNFFDPMDESCTIAFWFKTYDPSATRSLLRKQWHDENKVGFNLTISGGGIAATVREFNGLSNTKTLSWSSALAGARWYHVALQFDRAANLARLFVDGVQRSTAALDAERFIFQGRQPLLLGPDAGGQVAFDEFRYYSKALSTAEIQALHAVGHIPASGPTPADGERDVALLPMLKWIPGRASYQHDLFFGTNLTGVTAATTNSPEYLGRRATTNYTPPSALLANTEYFWRVDEILGGTNVAPGSVWSFRTAVDSIHGGLKLHLSLDSRDTLGNVTYDRAGPPFHDGTLFNSPVPANGQVAQAFEFDGTSHYVEVPAVNLTTDTMTMLAWVRRNGSVNNSAGMIFHRASGPTSGMNVSSGNRLGYHWNDAANTYNFSTGPMLPDGQWALAVLVVEPARAIVYLGTTDGLVTAATNNVAHGLCTFSGPFRVASDSSSGSRYFKGAFDEVGIWNRALTRSEIGLILTNGLTGGGIDDPPPAPQPGTFTWTGSADNLWNNAPNWANATLPGAADTAIFDESSAQNLSTDLAQSFSVAGLLITGKLRALGIASAGSILTLNAGGIKLSNSFTTLSLAAPVTLGANQSWTVSEFATLNVSSNITGGGRTLTLAADGTVSLGGVFSGAGGLVKIGPGEAAITAGLQTFTGGMIVSNGTLKALGGEWARSFFANVSPRTVTVHSNATLETTTHSLGGLGASFYPPTITLNEGATWRMNAEQYLGGNNLVLKGATVFVAANDLRLQGSTVNVLASALPSSITGAGSITLHGNTTFNVADGSSASDLTLDVPVGNSGSRTLTKTGAGTLVLTEPATFAGPTTISAGTLSLNGGKDTLPQAMSVSISSGATLRLNNHDQALGSLTGNGNVELGYGALTLTLTSTQTFGGVISGSPNGAPPASGNTEQAPNPGGFTKSGTGRLTLSVNNPYTGDTLITAGTLALGANGAMSGSSNILLFSAGTLDVTAHIGGRMVLDTGQTLGGNGTVLGALVISGGAVLSPGESVGTLVTGAQTWSGGGAYRWEITHAGTPGSSDLLVINGSLAISATPGNKFTLRLVSPDGPLPGFDNRSNYVWTIAGTTGGTVAFDPTKFNVDTSGLGVNPAGGSFDAQLQGNNVVVRFLAYVPPTSPPYVTNVAILSDGSFTLGGTGAVSQPHILLTASNLIPPIVWSPIATNSANANGTFSFMDLQATNHPSRFYRVATP